MSFAIGLTSWVLSGLGLLLPGEASATRPSLAERAYSGVVVRDDPSGALLVSGVLPGPLGGDGYRSRQLDRGDTILAMNGRRVNAESFRQVEQRSRVGDVLRLRVKRTGSKQVEALPRAVRDGPEEELEIVLDAASRWSGPLALSRSRPLPATRPFLPEGPAAVIEQAVERHGLRAPRDRLLALLADVQRANAGANVLDRVAVAMLEPRSLPDLEQEVADTIRPLAGEGGLPGRVFAALLDVVPPETTRPQAGRRGPATSSPASSREVVATLDAAWDDARQALASLDEREQRLLESRLPWLLEILAQRAELSGDGVAELLEAMRCTPRLERSAWLRSADRLVQLAGEPVGLPLSAQASLPGELAGAAEGPVRGVLRCRAGWIVFGGEERNRYDMSRLAAVFDPGGDDEYDWPTLARPRVQVVIDERGNDVHRGHVASALLGVCVVADQAGDDRYESDRPLAVAGAAGGVAILVDRHGHDRYAGTYWSIGASIYGAALLLDLSGDDTYLADDTSQAIGGPGGAGILLDAAGNDRYHVDGKTPSAYAQAGEFYAMSQGIGLGLRGYESGGIGVLFDRGGDDEYVGGEFAQAGGYFLGLGILRDEQGRDRYAGRRYAQGFGCHQGVGILVELSGDDQYLARTAANQGAAWDLSVGMLVDHAGNDRYRGGGLAQGSASMQGFAALFDLDGDDEYVASEPSQGRSGGNAYHFATTGTRSFSVLLDLAGKDHSSSGRGNGVSLDTGPTPPGDLPDATLHGLFIDLP